MTDIFDDPQYRQAKASSNLHEKIQNLEAKDNAIFEVKTTTGDPTGRGNFHFVINTFDNTVKVYGDEGWRTLVSW
jgi:hypothetical protein